MAMGRKGATQPPLWVPHSAVAKAPGHAFYEKLNELLAKHRFDARVEELCQRFYASDEKQGRRSIPPGVYFRMLLIGYFEGIESERGICWRCADSLSLRTFLGLELSDGVPEHSTLSRIRTRLEGSVYEEVFRLVLSIVEQEGLLRGRVIGVDSTYLRADASMKTIVRRDTNESYKEYLKRLARESGIENPTDEDARRMDRRRKKKTSNKDWRSPTDPDARITRLKDGRTKTAYKAENAVDLETGAILAAEIHSAIAADTATVLETTDAARANVLSAVEKSEREENSDDDDSSGPTATTPSGEPGPIELIADKGYHSARTLVELENRGFRTYIPEPKQQGRRHWQDKGGRATAEAVYRNRKRTKRSKSKALHRRRGELTERPFAHLCETGAARRTRLRRVDNVAKRYRIHAAAANLGLVMRTLFRFGSPREYWDAAVKAREAAAAAFGVPFAWLLLTVSSIWWALSRLLRTATANGISRYEASGYGATLKRSLVAVSSTGC